MSRIRISNETLNCYGTWVKTSGVDISQYEKNPVILWMHERGKIVGYMKDIKVEGEEITGEPVFDEVTELSRQLKAQWDKGSLKMGSPRFVIIETSEEEEDRKPGQSAPTITKSKLLEFSMVDIGGNDDNIRLSLDDSEDNLILAATDIPGYNTIINNNNTNEVKMNKEWKQIALMLGMAEDAAEEKIKAEVNVLLGYKAKADKLETELKDVKKELEDIRLATVTQMVDDAIASGKINATSKKHFLELGVEIGADSLKRTFDSMSAAVRPSTLLNHPGGTSVTATKKKFSELTADEIKLMRSENLDEYKRLYKEEFGIECKI